MVRRDYYWERDRNEEQCEHKDRQQDATGRGADGKGKAQGKWMLCVVVGDGMRARHRKVMRMTINGCNNE